MGQQSSGLDTDGWILANKSKVIPVDTMRATHCVTNIQLTENLSLIGQCNSAQRRPSELLWKFQISLFPHVPSYFCNSCKLLLQVERDYNATRHFSQSRLNSLPGANFYTAVWGAGGLTCDPLTLTHVTLSHYHMWHSHIVTYDTLTLTHVTFSHCHMWHSHIVTCDTLTLSHVTLSHVTLWH